MIIIIMMIMIIIIMIMITLIPHLHTMNYHDVRIWAYSLVIPTVTREVVPKAYVLPALAHLEAQAPKPKGQGTPLVRHLRGNGRKPMEKPRGRYCKIIKSMEHLWKP